MDHSDLVAELERIEKLAPFERLKLAKEKRTLQLRLYEQRERDYLKQKPTSNLKNKPVKHSRNVRFVHNVVLLEAAARNDIDEVRRLLMKGVSPDSVNEDGLTALHQCCIDDSENMMKLLIEFGANVNAEDSEKWTPLHAAATCGHLHLVKYLISKGANLLAVNADGNMPYDICEDEQTLDYIESEMANRGVTQELIDQTRASMEKQMLTDLKRCAANGQSLEYRDSVGATPLHIAAANGYLSVVEFLLDQHVATDSKDNDGWQPIHAAACWGQVEILELLVQNGADLKAKTKNHETPFDICEDPELKARITALRNEQENRAKAEHHKSRGSKTSGTNTRTHSVRRNSTRDKSLTPKKHVKNEAIIGFQGESHMGETSDDKPSSNDMNGEGANSDEIDTRNIYHNLKRDTLGQIQINDNEKSRLKGKDATNKRTAPPPPSDKVSENGNIPISSELKPHYSPPAIMNASALSDNKIDIHVSVTINANGSLASSLSSGLHGNLHSVPSLSGVSCTLADLKKQRSQSRVVVATSTPCILNSSHNSFIFPGLENGNHNGANAAPDTQHHFANNLQKLSDDMTGTLVAPPSPTSSIRIFRGGTSEPVGGAKPKKNSCCVLL